MLVEPVQEVGEVGGGELPFERSGCLVVAGLEGRQAVDDDVEIGEVVGRDYFRWTMEK